MFCQNQATVSSKSKMAFKFIVCAAFLTVARAAGPAAYDIATTSGDHNGIGISQESTQKGHGGQNVISSYTRSEDSAHSTVRVSSHSISNDVLKYDIDHVPFVKTDLEHATPLIAKTYAAPYSYAAPAAPLLAKTYAAPAPLLTKTYDAPLSYAAPAPLLTKTYDAPAPLLSKTYIEPYTYAAPAPLLAKTYPAPTPLLSKTYETPYSYETSAPLLAKTYAAPAPLLSKTYAAPYSYPAPAPLLAKTYPAPAPVLTKTYGAPATSLLTKSYIPPPSLLTKSYEYPAKSALPFPYDIPYDYPSLSILNKPEYIDQPIISKNLEPKIEIAPSVHTVFNGLGTKYSW